MRTILPAAAAALLLAPVASAAFAEEGGVVLSQRELRRENVRIVRERAGYVAEVNAPGLPFLYGLGDATGDPSSEPVVDGKTSSVVGSTRSGGIVPGQEPE